MSIQALSKITKNIRLLVLSLWFIAPLAAAEDTHYELQYLLLESATVGATYRPNALLYKHIIPYNKFVNLEGHVALGITEETAKRKTGLATNYSQSLRFSNLLGLMVKVYGAIEPRVHGYVHFGLSRVDLDLSTQSGINGPNGSQSETGLAYGVGMTFNLLKKGAFVFEFTQLPEVEAGSDKFNTVYIGLGYQMPFE